MWRTLLLGWCERCIRRWRPISTAHFRHCAPTLRVHRGPYGPSNVPNTFSAACSRSGDVERDGGEGQVPVSPEAPGPSFYQTCRGYPGSTSPGSMRANYTKSSRKLSPKEPAGTWCGVGSLDGKNRRSQGPGSKGPYGVRYQGGTPRGTASIWDSLNALPALLRQPGRGMPRRVACNPLYPELRGQDARVRVVVHVAPPSRAPSPGPRQPR